ncbi:MFS transporter [Pseudomonas xantholysinigenes]|uniref:MFS transporter n=1 Tax=Pseudomonas xantholysinigenes TaxID=2745490 RepID=A0A9E6U087_9PSED|nr:MFS transporter [Pseudomonas xantholysinigenes]QXI40285.1 MFS transporter [Pseudomonas xantholysinigenes]
MNKQHSAALVAGVLSVGFLVMFFSSAIKGLFQVYFVDLAAHFGGSRSALATGGTLFVLTIGLASPLVGALSDRVGPLWTVVLGSVCGGVVLLGVSLFDTHLMVFIVLYGLLGAFALAAMTYVPMGILVDRLVTEKSKAFAFAVVTNGTAIGFVVLSPLWIWLAPTVPWQTLFGGVGLVFLLPLSAALFWVARTVPLAAQPTSDNQPTSLGFLLGDARFLLLALSFATCGATMAFIDVHLVPYWQGEGVALSVQASSLSLLGVLELISGLLAGWLATRYNKGALLAFFYLLRCAAVALLLVQPSTTSVYLFAIIFGASYLGTVVLTSAFCFDLYGSQIKGKVFGALFLVHQLGAMAATQLGALDYDRNHSYQLTALVLTVATAAAAGLSALLLPWGRKAPGKTLAEA